MYRQKQRELETTLYYLLIQAKTHCILDLLDVLCDTRIRVSKETTIQSM